MVTNFIKRILTANLILIIFFAIGIWAEEPTFYFEFQDEKPVFTQILNWEEVDGAYYYELTVVSEKGVIAINKQHIETLPVEVKLKPGKYRYQVAVFNLLNQKESENDWQEFEIKQAVLPVIKNITPSTIWIEDNLLTLSSTGSGFADDCTISFVSNTDRNEEIVIKPEKHSKTYLQFYLKRPEKFLGKGWHLQIKHPSGLAGYSEPFYVKYRRPVDFYAGVGFTPLFPLFDKWYVGLWNNKIYPFSVTATVGFIFAKPLYGFFGLEYRGNVRLVNTKAKSIVVKSFYLINSLNFVYEYWFNMKWAAIARTGVGVSYSKFKVSYTNNTNMEQKTWDPCYQVGLGVRWRFLRFAYADFSIQLEHILHKNVNIIGIIPEVSVGFRY